MFDGLDLGWHYTSSLDVTITHDLSVTSDEVKGVKKKCDRTTSLAMSSVGKIQIGRTDTDTDDARTAANQIYYALSADRVTRRSRCDGRQRPTLWTFNPGSCQPAASDQTLWRL